MFFKTIDQWSGESFVDGLFLRYYNQPGQKENLNKYIVTQTKNPISINELTRR